jgi:gamma-glutamyltranspeptidase/glutathione hydrolase
MGNARPVSYRNAQFHVMPGLTAGPTFARVLEQLESADLSTPASAYVAYARALDRAYAERLGKMGDDGEVPEAPGCTTHFSVVDRDGNMVSHTQTLLSIFGSRVVSPATGFLMNNGIMWFDPEQGRPNSLAPGKACLMNVCPILGETVDTRFAFGASGGRKIVSAVSQLASFVVDGEMDIEAAFHTPRIDMSGGEQIIADETLPPEVLGALNAEKPTVPTRRTVSPYAFACPAGVMRKDGKNSGCTEVMSPWGDAITEGQT